MPNLWLTVGLAAALVALVAARWLAVWFGNRGDRLVTCPENRRPAGVRVNARAAALSGLGSGPKLRLESCSRWPERAGCGQECLRQIEEAPEGCLVRNLLVEWHRGKSCHYCGRPFDAVEWLAQKPALLTSDKTSKEWRQIAVEDLPAILETASPVCFACHTANTLVRERPDLVIDRSGR